MNDYERVIEVTVWATPEGHPALSDSKLGREVKRYVVYDTDMSVYRSAAPLSDGGAWCSCVTNAKWHLSEKQAQDALYEIWAERMTAEGGEE